jgi:hypothetical protein
MAEQIAEVTLYPPSIQRPRIWEYRRALISEWIHAGIAVALASTASLFPKQKDHGHYHAFTHRFAENEEYGYSTGRWIADLSIACHNPVTF